MLYLYSELAREKIWSRIHLIPLLQAEEDRDLVRRHLADKAREKELMGSETSVYHSDRYVGLPRLSEASFRHGLSTRELEVKKYHSPDSCALLTL